MDSEKNRAVWQRRLHFEEGDLRDVRIHLCDASGRAVKELIGSAGPPKKGRLAGF